MNTRAIVLLAVLAALSATIVQAGCTDTDNGPLSDLKDVSKFLTLPGTAVDQFKTYTDACVAKQFSDKKTTEGEWIREYYCAQGIAKHKDYKCVDFGFVKCTSDSDGAYCKSNNPTISQPAKVQKAKKQIADFYCGNKIMDRAKAECYPPGKICVKDKLPGQCSSDCKCALLTPKTEEPEKEATESKEETPETEEKEASIDIIVPEQENVKTATEKKIEEKKEETPIKQTLTLRVISKIASTAKKIWSGITGLF